jgi:hypothetical protein
MSIIYEFFLKLFFTPIPERLYQNWLFCFTQSKQSKKLNSQRISNLYFRLRSFDFFCVFCVKYDFCCTLNLANICEK